MKTIAVVQAAFLAFSIAGAAGAAPLDDASYCYHHISGRGCGSVPGWRAAFHPAQQAGVPAASHFGQTLSLLPAEADAPSRNGTERDAGAFHDNSAASVPEPDHYSMLLIGLLLLAFTAPGHATEKFTT